MKELDPLNLPLHSLVRVCWKDSNYSKGWRHPEEKTAVIPDIYSVGYVTHSDATALELTGTMGTDGSRLNPLSIPPAAIVSVESLKGTK